ncbi:hypothetical protein EMPS_07509 [Entomortierella parvispora]|uniref:RlpA-like protein double-psi beta-barrel domain-containing protein n=1 Tax=Entomortierella parvispora TaxID=205924 RepID=A0A9P3HEK7_9FUNG|nr:hypothetical protein EMPS_07509 [Entomortierella parvispora]
MTKFTSLLLITTAAIASFSSAAPIVSPTTTVVPTDIPTAVEPTVPEPTIVAFKDNSAFASSVKYTGKATWFTDSYGSCNVNWDGNVEPTVALNAHQMGEQSWGNSACGQKVHITNKANQKTVVARVVDKCPGDECAWGSLDLSPAAFTEIGELDSGILNVEWSYI